MINYKKAKKILIKSKIKIESELVGSMNSLNRVCAKNIYSSSNYPAGNNTAFDGYAIKSRDTLKLNKQRIQKFKILKTIAAGDNPKIKNVKNFTTIEVMTGALIPRPFDTIIPIEQIKYYPNNKKKKYILLDKRVNKNQHVRFFGSDYKRKELVIAAGTLIAGLTNVVTVSAGAGPDRIGLDCMASEVSKGSGFIGAHGIGHGGSGAGMSSGECHALIRRKCLEKLAGFLRRLEAVPEGDGTMLDNTLVVYMSDSAEGHHPVCQEWPFVLIGDLGGRLKLGNRYLRYPWYGEKGHRTIANLYLSLLHAVGEKRKNFGVADFGLGDLDQAGPLAEIMV